MKPYYQVVRFSPDPEVVEPVNVALFVATGRNRLVYDETFPKLSCVAPRFDRDLLDIYLRHLSSAVEDAGIEGGRVISSASPQFTLTGPHEFVTDEIEDFIPILVQRFLAKVGTRRTRQAQVQYIQSRLDELLMSRFHIPSSVLCKQAAPQDYLTSEVRRHLAADDFKLTRVLNAKTHLVAMDAINPTAAKYEVEHRAMRIGYAFHQLGKVQKSIETMEGRTLYRAAIILGSDVPTPASNAHLEFAKDTLQTNAESVFDMNMLPPGFIRVTEEAIGSMGFLGLERPH